MPRQAGEEATAVLLVMIVLMCPFASSVFLSVYYLVNGMEALENVSAYSSIMFYVRVFCVVFSCVLCVCCFSMASAET